MTAVLFDVPARDLRDITADERAEDEERNCALLRKRRDGSALDVAGAARAQLLGWAIRGRGPAAFVWAGDMLTVYGDDALRRLPDLGLRADLQRRVAGLLMVAGLTLTPDCAQTTMEV